MKYPRMLSLCVCLTSFALLPLTALGQVTATSFSTGGVAISSAHGWGNTQIQAHSAASGGGIARATMFGTGIAGGTARGSAIAASHGGVAIANGRSDARGWGAVAQSNSIAASSYGIAVANGTAVARGNRWAGSDSVATALGGVAISDSQATNRGWTGGFRRSYGIAHTRGPVGGGIQIP